MVQPDTASRSRFAQPLWTLVAANMVLALAIASLPRTPLFVSAYSLNAARAGALLGQLVMLGLVASLYPKRPFTGLLAAVAMALLRGVVTSRIDQIVGFIGLEEIVRTLPVVAALQGVRLILGWRLTSEPGDSSRPGQFRIVDLLEWVTTIAVGLGSIMFLISDMDRLGVRSIPAVDLFLELVPLPLLIGVPVALAIVAERPPGAWGKLALTMW